MTTTLQASVLAAPPPAPIPALTAPLAPDDLADALRSFSGSYYANHPFHQLMHEGKLTKTTAPRLGCQPTGVSARDPAQRMPRFSPTVPTPTFAVCGCSGLSTTMERSRAPAESRCGSGWERRSAFRATEMEDERHVLPGVRFATEAYVTFCKTKPWIDSVASSLTELFAPDLMRKRIAAFPQHYSWVRPEALDYFKSRLTQAPRDSQQGLASRARRGARPSRRSAARSRPSPSSSSCCGS